MSVEEMFPFLIGTVRTKLLCKIEVFKFVSIPHRYGKNQQEMSKYGFSSIVSIPHRYGKNCKNLDVSCSVDTEFPFLIGTVRTGNQPKRSSL